jgi:hypothetical protein
VKKKKLKVADDGITYEVFRVKGGSPDSITGSGLSANVQDGSLIISKNGLAVFIYGPGQWLTVNEAPI